jgi:hypothetical protein
LKDVVADMTAEAEVLGVEVLVRLRDFRCREGE